MITFMFSDIEGSTPLWERDPEGMRAALTRHNAIMHEAVTANEGQVFKTVGDEFCVVFTDPAAAVRAALAGQRELKSAEWGSTGPLKVRMGLHLGHVQVKDGDYASHTVNRVARIMGAAHGGQILLSGEVVEVVRRTLPEDITLKDLCRHRMKGMETPVISVGPPACSAQPRPPAGDSMSQARIRKKSPTTITQWSCLAKRWGRPNWTG
jgi:class 3 adenylate cyclase